MLGFVKTPNIGFGHAAEFQRHLKAEEYGTNMIGRQIFANKATHPIELIFKWIIVKLWF